MENKDCDTARGQCPLGITAGQWATIIGEHERMMHTLYADNGEKGFVVVVRDFIRDHENEERIRMEIQNAQHTENLNHNRKINLKLTVIGLVVTLLGAICAAGTLVVAFRSLRSQFDPTKIFHSQQIDPAEYAERQHQDAQF